MNMSQGHRCAHGSWTDLIGHVIISYHDHSGRARVDWGVRGNTAFVSFRVDIRRPACVLGWRGVVHHENRPATRTDGAGSKRETLMSEALARDRCPFGPCNADRTTTWSFLSMSSHIRVTDEIALSLCAYRRRNKENENTTRRESALGTEIPDQSIFFFAEMNATQFCSLLMRMYRSDARKTQE